jgi:hypothetical protein
MRIGVPVIVQRNQAQSQQAQHQPTADSLTMADADVRNLLHEFAFLAHVPSDPPGWLHLSIHPRTGQNLLFHHA